MKISPRPNLGKPPVSEQALQRAVVAHLRVRGAPDSFSFHVANGGFRRPTEAAILKSMGVRAGVPDLICIYRGGVFALELKAEGGKLSDRQREVIELMQRAGATVAVAHGLDAAIQQLETWGVLRGRAS